MKKHYTEAALLIPWSEFTDMLEHAAPHMIEQEGDFLPGGFSKGDTIKVHGFSGDGSPGVIVTFRREHKS